VLIFATAQSWQLSVHLAPGPDWDCKTKNSKRKHASGWVISQAKRRNIAGSFQF
jgi:hypothetical protein